MSGNSWGKAKPNGFGGYRAAKDGYDSLHSTKVDSKGYVDRENHVHFHKDGLTIMKNGKKTTVFKSNR